MTRVLTTHGGYRLGASLGTSDWLEVLNIIQQARDHYRSYGNCLGSLSDLSRADCGGG